MPTIKNIIIFIIIGAIFSGVYFFFIKKDPETDNLISSSTSEVLPGADASTRAEDSVVAQEFLSLLLNVKNIKLDYAIFSDDAFINLKDSTIVLVPDGNEGRVNPFAPFGSDVATVTVPTCTLPKVLDILTNVCVSPPIN